jgi:hypothetical protein
MGSVKKFWELFEQSIIIQACVTLAFTIAIVYLVVSTKPIPVEVWTAYGLVLGYWFGTKQNYAITKTVAQLKELSERPVK